MQFTVQDGNVLIVGIGEKLFIDLQLLPLRPARTDRRGRARLAVQHHTRSGPRLYLHIGLSLYYSHQVTTMNEVS